VTENVPDREILLAEGMHDAGRSSITDELGVKLQGSNVSTCLSPSISMNLFTCLYYTPGIPNFDECQYVAL
jgi:hypothetical protein